jgi:hypothetical protein
VTEGKPRSVIDAEGKIYREERARRYHRTGAGSGAGYGGLRHWHVQ